MKINPRLSPRLQTVVDALPLKSGIRVLEIGCGPGAMAREIATRIGNGFVLGIDRSEKAIEIAIRSSQEEINAGRLEFRSVSAEEFALLKDDQKFDLAVAIRVGALDGRHPEQGKIALANIAKVLKRNGKLFVDGGKRLKEIKLKV